MTMGDRVAVLNAGEIEQCDSPRALYDRPANLFVAAFIGSPSMNFFAATIEPRSEGLVAVAGELVLPLDEGAWTADLRSWSGRTVTVGARPEAISAQPFRPGCPSVSAEVDFVEELGAELVVHSTVSTLGGSHAINAAIAAATNDGEVVTASNIVTKLPPNAGVRATDKITLYIDSTQIHLFDPAGPSLRGKEIW